MFGSNVLDTAIGLIFVFLCVSLVCTAVNELIAIAFASRARDLERGIRNMLDSTSKYPQRWWQGWNDTGKHVDRMAAATPWADKFFKHQLIDGIRKDGEMPSYIPSQDFVNVLLHLVDADAAASPDGPPAKSLSGLSGFNDIRATINKVSNQGIREVLLPMLCEAESDLTKDISALKKFNDRIEIWFDNGMDRVGGWYKKRTQWILLLVALFVVGALNVDTIAIYRTLARDSTLRASIVAAAEKTALSSTEKQSPSPTTQSVSQAIENVKGSLANFDQIGIPVGWSNTEYEALKSEPLNKIFGLLATALAASLGAPFWFDVLNKFMAVRGTGKAPEEKPKDPKVVLQPRSPSGG